MSLRRASQRPFCARKMTTLFLSGGVYTQNGKTYENMFSQKKCLHSGSLGSPKKPVFQVFSRPSMTNSLSQKMFYTFQSAGNGAVPVPAGIRPGGGCYEILFSILFSGSMEKPAAQWKNQRFNGKSNGLRSPTAEEIGINRYWKLFRILQAPRSNV